MVSRTWRSGYKSIGMTSIALAAICAIAAVTPNALAGIIRDDVPDSQYTGLAAQPQYAPVGHITFSGFHGSGTLISSRWVLTVNHLVNLNPTTFTPDGQAGVNVAQQISYPGDTTLGTGFDIGLMRLDTPITTITPATRYVGAAPVGTGVEATFVGYGQSGTGLTGATIAAGTKRAGTNVLEVVGGSAPVAGFSSNYMFSDFDNPANAADSIWGLSTPTSLEVMLGIGDSGGGVFTTVGGVTRLVGVNSFGLAGGVTTTGPGFDYGDAIAAIRVSITTAALDPNDWIDNTIAAAWTNAAGGSAQNAANWQIGNAANTLLPDSTDILGFNIVGTYAVTFTGANSYSKILARKGTVTLDLGGATQTTTSLMQHGSVTVGRSSGDVANLTLANGTLASTDAIIGRSTGSTGTVALTGAGTQWNLSDSLHIGGSNAGSGGNGSLAVNTGTSVQVTNILKVWSGGTLTINGGAVIAGRLQLSNGFVTGSGGTLTASSIEGNGTVNFPVQTSGAVSPGFSAGTLNFNQGLTLQNGASLVAELGGTNAGTTYDRVNVVGGLQVDGLLQIKIINGFESVVNGGNQFTIVNGSLPITGTFDNAPNNVRIATVDGKGSFIVHYGIGSTSPTDDVVLTNFLPTTPGDFDADGDVDGADFVVWQTNFPATTGHYLGTGDADADGDVDGADFVAWQTHFPTPASQGFAAVPEPAGWILAIFSLTATWATARRVRHP